MNPARETAVTPTPPVADASALQPSQPLETRLICKAMRIRVLKEFGDASAVRKLLSGLVAH